MVTGVRQGEYDQEPVVHVQINSLAYGDSPRIFGESPEHIEALASAVSELPPIIVHRSTMRVIDGMHRLKAAILRGDSTIATRFFDGDEADAFVIAVQANIAHGLPLTLAERKQAAQRIMTTHPQWSDRMVASVTGLAAGTAAEVRKQVHGGAVLAHSRIGQDGRIRPIDGAAGRRLAGEMMTKNPELSLRQVARAAGISPETVRDVRNRLSRGEDVVPRQRSVNGRRADCRSPLNPGALNRSPRDRAEVVARLKADPAVRLRESGRALLRLLNVHTLESASWEDIIENVPPHWFGAVAQLARDHAEIWAEFAARLESRTDEDGPVPRPAVPRPAVPPPALPAPAVPAPPPDSVREVPPGIPRPAGPPAAERTRPAGVSVPG
ncbi:ParB/RepB/Spo0J family partition protein [Streptomyces sp. B6B3]|uniref:ParB/RepB/Spo0J family partition protein n=1 Tax=Streptomyces sp. B6B3 TaxID=3153570 RepID=UPI00325CFE45